MPPTRVVIRFIWRGTRVREADIEVTGVFARRGGRVGAARTSEHAEALEAVGLSEQDAHADS